MIMNNNNKKKKYKRRKEKKKQTRKGNKGRRRRRRRMEMRTENISSFSSHKSGSVKRKSGGKKGVSDYITTTEANTVMLACSSLSSDPGRQ